MTDVKKIIDTATTIKFGKQVTLAQAIFIVLFIMSLKESIDDKATHRSEDLTHLYRFHISLYM